MKFAPLLYLCVALIAVLDRTPASGAVHDADQSREITSLEKKLAATRDELAAVRTALAISKSETEAAVAKAKALTQPDSQVEVLRNEVRLLEQDLRSATAGLQRLAADKAAAESALKSNQTRGEKAGAAETKSLDPKIAVLQAELIDTRSRLSTAEKNGAARDTELAQLRARLATAEALPRIPEDVAQELASLRSQTAVAAALEARARQLETENSALLVRAAGASDQNKEIARMAAAHTAVERRLAAAHEELAVVTKERDDLKTQSSRVNELEARLRQFESTKTSVAVAGSEATVSKEEFARVSAAQASAESKLSTVLRSFTLLTKERDELRARLAELSARNSLDQEKR